MKKVISVLLIILTASCAVTKTNKMDTNISVEELKSTREFFNELGKIYELSCPDIG